MKTHVNFELITCHMPNRSLYPLIVLISMPTSFPLTDPTDLIWRKGISFEAMTGRTAPSSDGLLAEFSGVFLGCKANARRSLHSPQDHFIITLISSDRRE